MSVRVLTTNPRRVAATVPWAPTPSGSQMRRVRGVTLPERQRQL